MKKLVIGMTGLTAAFAVAAIAQNASPPTRSDVPAAGVSATAPVPSAATVQFSSVDQNKDGKLSQAEALSYGSSLGTNFAKLDTNADGFVSQIEYNKWGAESHEGHTDGMKPGKSDSSTRTPGAGGQ